MNWKFIYNMIPIRKMGWYYASLDPDLEKALHEHQIKEGSFLDVGTGPGTQAVRLAERGFKVTGTDISGTAVQKASELSKDVCFLQDDILHTSLEDQFDYVFDRGCFHVLREKDWPSYIENLTKIVKPDGKGWVFLKCMSAEQDPIGIGPIRIPESKGPRRFSREKIQEIFSAHFDILDIQETEYQGTREVHPKTLFITMISTSK